MSTPKTIDITPTWAQAVEMCFALIESGENQEAKETGRSELRRLAQFVDGLKAVEWGVIFEAAETRTTQWQGIANGDEPIDQIDELCEVYDSMRSDPGNTEAQDIAKIQRKAIDDARKALGWDGK